MLAVVFVILVGVVGIVAYSALSTGNPTKVRHIMAGLGLQGNEEGSQFYKWGWHQDQENRVSAERMVKQAFQKAGVWLDRQDLAFFESQCERHESRNEVDESQIEERIHAIIGRSERVRRWVADQVHTVVHYVQSLNPQEAANALHESGIEADPEQAIERLTSLEMQRMLYRHGASLLALNAKGLTVKDPVTAQTFELAGLDSWRHLIRMFKDDILDKISGRRTTISSSIARSLRSAVEIGFFHDIENDIERHRIFIKRIHDQFHNKEIRVSLERARAIDAILYKWKFDEGAHFNQEDQNRIRELLSRLDLASRFREILFDGFEESFSSLFKLIRLFPREVIFYGGNGAARTFATDQYFRHFLALMEAIGGPSGRDTSPPTIIWINSEQIEKMRQGPKRGSNAVTLSQLITDQQRFSRLEQGISEEIANNRGWIVNLSLDDPSAAEFEALNKDPFKKYTRFHCEAGEDVDFLNNTYNAKKSRIQFFNMVIDTLVGIPSIQETAPDATASSTGGEQPSAALEEEMDDDYSSSA